MTTRGEMPFRTGKPRMRNSVRRRASAAEISETKANEVKIPEGAPTIPIPTSPSIHTPITLPPSPLRMEQPLSPSKPVPVSPSGSTKASVRASPGIVGIAPIPTMLGETSPITGIFRPEAILVDEAKASLIPAFSPRTSSSRSPSPRNVPFQPPPAFSPRTSSSEFLSPRLPAKTPEPKYGHRRKGRRRGPISVVTVDSRIPESRPVFTPILDSEWIPQMEEPRAVEWESESIEIGPSSENPWVPKKSDGPTDIRIIGMTPLGGMERVPTASKPPTTVRMCPFTPRYLQPNLPIRKEEAPTVAANDPILSATIYLDCTKPEDQAYNYVGDRMKAITQQIALARQYIHSEWLELPPIQGVVTPGVFEEALSTYENNQVWCQDQLAVLPLVEVQTRLTLLEHWFVAIIEPKTEEGAIQREAQKLITGVSAYCDPELHPHIGPMPVPLREFIQDQHRKAKFHLVRPKSSKAASSVPRVEPPSTPISSPRLIIMPSPSAESSTSPFGRMKSMSPFGRVTSSPVPFETSSPNRRLPESLGCDPRVQIPTFPF